MSRAGHAGPSYDMKNRLIRAQSSIETLSGEIGRLRRQKAKVVKAVRLAVIYLEDGAPNTALDRLKKVLALGLALLMAAPIRAAEVNVDPAPVIEVRRAKDATWCWVWGGAALGVAMILQDKSARTDQEANDRLDRALFEVDFLAARQQGQALKSKASRQRQRAELVALVGVSLLTAGAISAAIKDDVVYVRRDIKFGGPRE